MTKDQMSRQISDAITKAVKTIPGFNGNVIAEMNCKDRKKNVIELTRLVAQARDMAIIDNVFAILGEENPIRKDAEETEEANANLYFRALWAFHEIRQRLEACYASMNCKGVMTMQAMKDARHVLCVIMKKTYPAAKRQIKLACKNYDDERTADVNYYFEAFAEDDLNIANEECDEVAYAYAEDGDDQNYSDTSILVTAESTVKYIKDKLDKLNPIKDPDSYKLAVEELRSAEEFRDKMTDLIGEIEEPTVDQLAELKYQYNSLKKQIVKAAKDGDFNAVKEMKEKLKKLESLIQNLT